MQKVWRCTVCGYLHQGPEPPGVCPVCGVDASRFVLVEDPGAGSGDKEEAKIRLAGLREHFVLHAVTAHFPNALTPILLLFALLALLGGRSLFAQSLLPLLAILAPLNLATMFSGMRDWKVHHQGAVTPIFRNKLVLAGLLSVLSLVALVWQWRDPRIFTPPDGLSWLFVLLLLVMLGCAVLLGHYGAVLVFGRRREQDVQDR